MTQFRSLIKLNKSFNYFLHSSRLTKVFKISELRPKRFNKIKFFLFDHVIPGLVFEYNKPSSWDNQTISAFNRFVNIPLCLYLNERRETGVAARNGPSTWYLDRAPFQQTAYTSHTVLDTNPNSFGLHWRHP